MFTVDGHTYERTEIQHWLDNGHDTSPITNLPLERNGQIDRSLTPNIRLRQAIEEWDRSRQAFQNSIDPNDLRLHASKQPFSGMTDADKQACPLYSDMARLHPETRGLAEIGVGQDKSVYRGLWKGQSVAILHMRRGSCETEARIFSLLGKHPHLVRFHGMAVLEDGSQSLVTELASFGSMDVVLEQNLGGLRSLSVEAWQKMQIEILSQVSHSNSR